VKLSAAAPPAASSSRRESWDFVLAVAFLVFIEKPPGEEFESPDRIAARDAR
jgi:hypothetical protein